MSIGLSQEAVDYLNWSSDMDRKIRFTEEEESEKSPTEEFSDFVLQDELEEFKIEYMLREDEAFEELESRLNK